MLCLLVCLKAVGLKFLVMTIRCQDYPKKINLNFRIKRLSFYKLTLTRRLKKSKLQNLRSQKVQLSIARSCCHRSEALKMAQLLVDISIVLKVDMILQVDVIWLLSMEEQPQVVKVQTYRLEDLIKVDKSEPTQQNLRKYHVVPFLHAY